MTQTNPEQWAVELWRKACHDYGGASIDDSPAEWRAVMVIQAAFAEREARLVGAITSADAIVCTPNTDGSHKITLHYPDTSTAMAAFVQLSDVADGGMKDRTHG